MGEPKSLKNFFSSSQTLRADKLERLNPESLFEPAECLGRLAFATHIRMGRNGWPGKNTLAYLWRTSRIKDEKKSFAKLNVEN